MEAPNDAARRHPLAGNASSSSLPARRTAMQGQLCKDSYGLHAWSLRRPSSARQSRRPRATLTPQDQRTEDYSTGRFG
jgi:hypothetical protein